MNAPSAGGFFTAPLSNDRPPLIEATSQGNIVRHPGTAGFPVQPLANQAMQQYNQQMQMLNQPPSQAPMSHPLQMQQPPMQGQQQLPQQQPQTQQQLPQQQPQIQQQQQQQLPQQQNPLQNYLQPQQPAVNPFELLAGQQPQQQNQQQDQYSQAYKQQLIRQAQDEVVQKQKSENTQKVNKFFGDFKRYMGEQF